MSKGIVLSRLSRKASEAKVLTVAAQEDDAIKHAARLGVPIAERFAEDGVSGWRKVKRPSFNAMLDTIERDGVTHLFLRAIDRASRRGSDLMRLIELCQERGTLIVIDGAPHDPTDPDVVFKLSIEAAMAVRESGLISKRTGKAKARTLETYAGGRRPFGYVKPDNAAPGYFDPQPDEWQALRDGFNMVVVDGRSTASVAREWNARGLRTPFGREFTASKAQRVLEAPVHAGLRVREGETLAVLKRPDGSAWPAVFTPEERDQLRAVLVARSRRPSGAPRRAPEPGLLSGVLRCGKCGEPLAIHRDRKRPAQSFYACRADGRRCNGCSVRVNLIEPHITEVVLEALNDAKVRRRIMRMMKARNTTTGENPLVIQDEMNAWSTDQAQRGIKNLAAYNATLDAYQARLDAAMRAFDDEGDASALLPFLTADDAAVVWKAAPADQLNNVVATLIDRIDVQPVERQGTRPPITERVGKGDVYWRW